MKTLRKALFTGALVLLPLILTLKIILWFIDAIEATTRQFFPTFIIPFDFPGLGFVLAFFFVLLVGLLTQNIAGNWVISWFDRLFTRIPVGGGLYSTLKKFLETVFSSRHTQQFTGVVLVEFPRNGVYSVGFRTGEPDPIFSAAVPKPVVNVFVPCTPNPTSGFYLLVPEDAIIPLDIPVQDAVKIVISLGIVTSEHHE